MSFFDPTTLQQVNVAAAGLAAGFTGTVCGHPLDLIKVRLQARSEYKGCMDCIYKTFRNDGVRGMFRGMSSPLFGSTLMNAFTFTCYNRMNAMQEPLMKRFGKDNLSFYNHFLSGGAVGLLSSFVGTPLEVIKVRMQLDERKSVAASSPKSLPSASASVTSSPASNASSPASVAQQGRQYNGFFDCGRQIMRQQGFRGFYTGYLPTVTRDMSFCSVYFAVYDNIKQTLQQQPLLTRADGGFSPLPIMLSGGISGALGWLVAVPLDVVKTLMQDTDKHQSTAATRTNNKPPSAFSVAKAHYKRVGFSGFYIGLTPIIVRAFITSSVRFITFEAALHQLNQWR